MRHGMPEIEMNYMYDLNFWPWPTATNKTVSYRSTGFVLPAQLVLQFAFTLCQPATNVTTCI